MAKQCSILGSTNFTDVHQKEKTNFDMGTGVDGCDLRRRSCGWRCPGLNSGDCSRFDCRSLFDLEKTLKLLGQWEVEGDEGHNPTGCKDRAESPYESLTAEITPLRSSITSTGNFYLPEP